MHIEVVVPMKLIVEIQNNYDTDILNSEDFDDFCSDPFRSCCSCTFRNTTAECSDVYEEVKKHLQGEK